VRAIERFKGIFGRAPRQASFDGAFASRANVADIKALGVHDVAFNKRCGLEVTDMVETETVYRALSAFRSGIEGTTCNLRILARHILAAA